ncbi:EF-hand domain-containing protein [Nocardiopsis sp. CNT-189]|uniref:EF-hand domain-containing protein n=1 Tax=Nocardiopsis oceanisediminis TaxID=2816862 RepID=UPI003B39BC0F
MPETTEFAPTFSLVDADGDGLISAEELTRLMEALGSPCTPERAQEVVRAMDGDGDGRISLEEFSRFMSGDRA